MGCNLTKQNMSVHLEYWILWFKLRGMLAVSSTHLCMKEENCGIA